MWINIKFMVTVRGHVKYEEKLSFSGITANMHI